MARTTVADKDRIAGFWLLVARELDIDKKAKEDTSTVLIVEDTIKYYSVRCVLQLVLVDSKL